MKKKILGFTKRSSIAIKAIQCICNINLFSSLTSRLQLIIKMVVTLEKCFYGRETSNVVLIDDRWKMQIKICYNNGSHHGKVVSERRNIKSVTNR